MMKIRPKIRDYEGIQDARRLLQAGGDMELLLLFFRDRGFDLADCIYAIQELFNYSFSDSKSAVVHSQAWARTYESSHELREATRDAIRKLAESKSPDLPDVIFEDDE